MVFKVGRGTIPIYLGYIRGCAKPKYGTKNIAKRKSTIGNIQTEIQ